METKQVPIAGERGKHPTLKMLSREGRWETERVADRCRRRPQHMQYGAHTLVKGVLHEVQANSEGVGPDVGKNVGQNVAGAGLDPN